MLETIELAALPEAVLPETLKFLNAATSALEISEMTNRHADFIQGVSTGEKVALNILAARDKAGRFETLSQLQAIPYFTEDKLKTLLAVFYVSTGAWEIGGDSKASEVKAAVVVDPPEVEGSESGATTELPADPLPDTPAPPPFLEKLLVAEVALMGRLSNANLKVSFQGFLEQLQFVSAVSRGRGLWTLSFRPSLALGQTPVPLRMDFEEGGIHLLAVTALWNPRQSSPIVVRL